MAKEKKMTFLLLGGLFVIVVGLFTTMYKSPTAFIGEEESEANIQDSAGIKGNIIDEFPNLDYNQIKVLSGTQDNPEELNRLKDLFTKEKNELGLGMYYKLIAKQTSSDSLYVVAGNHLVNSTMGRNREDKGSDLIFENMIECYENALKINDKNLSAKNALALCYIDYNNQVMKGVTLLKESLEQDSNNIEAIKYLGLLSIRSNQLEKAEKRFKKLVSLQPEISEHYFALSEIYTRKGDVNKGTYYLDIAKKLKNEEKL